MWGIIGTWEMVFDGIVKGSAILDARGHIFDAVEACVRLVEDCGDYTSVGYGGLPNALGDVEMDAAFMDGETLSFGAVGSVSNFANPCSIARKLMSERLNNFLVGPGAENYAENHGFRRKNMLTDNSKRIWLEHMEKVEQQDLSPYIGHDTVCALGLDNSGHMATCTSTSGLFYKSPGRVGDSPIPGAGFYVDNAIGEACATGLGEDILKGALSFQIVQLMGQGLSPQAACTRAVTAFNDQLVQRRGKAGDLSVIAMDQRGSFGAATNIQAFPFVVATEKHPIAAYVATYNDGMVTTKKM